MQVESQYDDDVDLILQLDDDRESLYELIASNPKYYLQLISSYNKLPSGHEIYLPDLLNLMQSRINKTKDFEGNLVIKFKFHDNDNWTTIGYGDITGIPGIDDLTYAQFSDRVTLMLDLQRKKPKKKQNENIKVSVQSLEELNLSRSIPIDRNISKMHSFLISIGRETKQEPLQVVNDPEHIKINGSEYHSIFDMLTAAELGIVPEVLESHNPMLVSNNVPMLVSNDVSDNVPNDVPDNVPDNVPNNVPNDVPNNVPEHANMPVKQQEIRYNLDDIENIKSTYAYHKAMCKGFKNILKALYINKT